MLIRWKWWFERKIHIILRRQQWQPVVFTVIPRRQNDDQQCKYYRSYRHVLALLAESVKTMISSSFSYVGVGCIRDEVGPEVNEERIASKGHLHYKTILSQNVPSEAQVKNFFVW